MAMQIMMALFGPLPAVQGGGDLAKRLRACGRSFADRWYEGISVRTRPGLKGPRGRWRWRGHRPAGGCRELPTGFGGGESGLCALRDHRPLLLGEGGVHVQ
jgi:hypothetical protein